MGEEKDCPIQHHDCPYFNPNLNKTEESWFSKNLSILVVATISICGWIYTAGTNGYHLTTIENRVITLESRGSETAQQTGLVVGFHEKRLSTVETDIKRMDNSMSEIKTDVKIIAEWVKEQKQIK
jgi:hypothetical protein